MKKFNTLGFTHHFLIIAVLVVGSVGWFGAYRLIQSKADTVTSVAVSSPRGCWIAGRVYDEKANSNKGACTKICRANANNYPNNKYNSKGYCTEHISLGVSKQRCTVELHRMYIDNIGCSRRADQDNTKNARQCQFKYPNYVASAKMDYCSKAKVAAEPVTGGTSSGTNIARVASFNVLGASHTDGPKENKPGAASYRPRLEHAVDVMKNSKLDIIGLQEFQQNQRQALMKKYGDYFGVFPQNPQYSGGNASVNSIVWNKAKYRYVSGGTKTFKYFFGNKNQYPWVKLKNKQTGNVVLVANTHDPAEAKGRAAGLRAEDARTHIQNARAWNKQGIQVVYTGDFNSHSSIRSPQDNYYTGNDRGKLPYCIMSKSGALVHAYDALHKRAKKDTCPAPNKNIEIDQVWVSPGTVVKKYGSLRGQSVKIATDHASVEFADIVLNKK